jgi:hypothetical protein
MKKRHMTPAEAVTAFEDTRARFMIHIHWGTFRLSLERINAAADWMNKILDDRPDLRKKILLMEPCNSVEIPAREERAPSKNSIKKMRSIDIHQEASATRH